jgi:imidazolonepropionase-like amidohydrolase
MRAIFRGRASAPPLLSWWQPGGLGDERQYHMHHQGFEVIADGCDEVRRTVRTLIREGVDTVKVNISGDPFYGKSGFGRRLSYTEAEVATASEEAHQRGAWLSCHARADESVKLALKYGFRVIYHCDFIEGETFEVVRHHYPPVNQRGKRAAIAVPGAADLAPAVILYKVPVCWLMSLNCAAVARSSRKMRCAPQSRCAAS